MQALQNIQRDSKVIALRAEVQQLRSLIDGLLPTFAWSAPDTITITRCKTLTATVRVQPQWQVFSPFVDNEMLALHLAIVDEHWWGPSFWRTENGWRLEFTSVVNYACDGPLLHLLLDRLKALDVPELSEQRRAALRQFLEAAAQLA
jgi:hypothetical protein